MMCTHTHTCLFTRPLHTVYSKSFLHILMQFQIPVAHAHTNIYTHTHACTHTNTDLCRTSLHTLVQSLIHPIPDTFSKNRQTHSEHPFHIFSTQYTYMHVHMHETDRGSTAFSLAAPAPVLPHPAAESAYSSMVLQQHFQSSCLSPLAPVDPPQPRGLHFPISHIRSQTKPGSMELCPPPACASLHP